MKECSVCGTKETPQWYADSTCKSCYRKKHRKDNIEKYKEIDKSFYESNKDHILARQKEYYQNNTEECKERSRNHRAIVGDQHRPGYKQKWYEDNREYMNRYYKFANAKRRAKILLATPHWMTQDHWEEIKRIYENCPEGHEVDHILPLQGKTVSGLHVPWNLQYLTISDNRKKKNKIL